MVLRLGLLGFIFCALQTYAETVIVQNAVSDINGEKPTEAVNDTPAVGPASVLDPLVLPVNETPVGTPMPDPLLPAAIEATPETDPPVPSANESPLGEPQKQGPPQERTSEKPSKELPDADAAAREEETRDAAKGQPLGWVFGLRAGFAIPTQKVIRDFGNSTSVGPLINLEALYAVKEWMRVGLMVEWHRHSIKMWGPEFGTLNTVSILPTVEFRPTRDFLEERGMRAVVPYAALGLGVNANSVSKGSGLPSTATVSFDNTLAFRVAGGLDVPIASGVALNAELAWNRNSGDYKLSSLATTSGFNASTLNVLFGLRAEF
jgi:hypothetical protein